LGHPHHERVEKRFARRCLWFSSFEYAQNEAKAAVEQITKFEFCTF